MVDRESPKIVTMQDGPSDLPKAGVALALCMHLTKRGLYWEQIE